MIKIIGWFIVIQFVFFSISLSAQKIGYVGDTAHIIYDKESSNSIVDSVIAIRHEFTWSSSWIVYFDKGQKHVAYKSYYNGDSAIRINFWRNGMLKETDIELKAGKFYNWIYREQYCENGQLVGKFYLTRFNQQVVSYYCNGNKKYKASNRSDDNIEVTDSLWHENGQLESVAYHITMFNGICRMHHNVGEWKYYNINGGIDSTHVYEDISVLHYPDCADEKMDTNGVLDYKSCIKGEGGIEKRYYPDGKIKVEGLLYDNLKDIVRDGAWWYYSEDGKKIKSEYYDKGKLLKTDK